MIMFSVLLYDESPRDIKRDLYGSVIRNIFKFACHAPRARV